MKSVRAYLKLSGGGWRVGGLLFALGWFMVCGGRAQMPGAAPESPPPKPLTISFQALFKGDAIHDGATLQAPDAIYLLPYLETSMVMNAGDTVTIDFYAGTNKLCSSLAMWHKAINPSAQPGVHVVPMIVVAGGFGYRSCVWSNAPAGSHVLIARAHGGHGLSAVSAPLHFTVLPSPPP
jgi:hypothetical protein